MSFFKFEMFMGCQCPIDEIKNNNYGPPFYYSAVVHRSINNTNGFVNFSTAQIDCYNDLDKNLQDLKNNYPDATNEIRHVETLIEDLMSLDEEMVDGYCNDKSVNIMEVHIPRKKNS